MPDLFGWVCALAPVVLKLLFRPAPIARDEGSVSVETPTLRIRVRWKRERQPTKR